MTWQQQSAIKRWFWKRRTLADRVRIAYWRVRQDGIGAFRSGLLGPPFGRRNLPAPRLLDDPRLEFLKNTPPILQTSRLQLTPLEVSDLDQLIDLFPPDSPTNTAKPRYWTTESILTRELLTAFQTWTVRLGTSSECIGHCGLTELTIDGVDELEIGYRIGEQYQGRGYATEAASAVRKLLFDHGVDHVISAIASDNTASQRVAQKNGMRWERQSLCLGKPVEIYGITRSDFEAPQPNVPDNHASEKAERNDEIQPEA